MASQALEVKKLVYLYLLHYAEKYSFNAFLKLCICSVNSKASLGVLKLYLKCIRCAKKVKFHCISEFVSS